MPGGFGFYVIHIRPKVSFLYVFYLPNRQSKLSFYFPDPAKDFLPFFFRAPNYSKHHHFTLVIFKVAAFVAVNVVFHSFKFRCYISTLTSPLINFGNNVSRSVERVRIWV